MSVWGELVARIKACVKQSPFSGDPAKEQPTPTAIESVAEMIVATVNSDSINYRSGASTSYASLGKVNRGDLVEVLDKVYNGTQWSQVRVNGSEAFIFTKYLAFAGDKEPILSIWPCVFGTISYANRFGYRIHPIYKTKKMHNGVDIWIGVKGKPVLAAEAGEVIALRNSIPGYSTSYSSGNYIYIDHGGGIQSHYLHLKQHTLFVKAGDIVKAGQQIATIGSTGASTADHLHFAVKEGGAYVDPLLYLPRDDYRLRDGTGWPDKYYDSIADKMRYKTTP